MYEDENLTFHVKKIKKVEFKLKTRLKIVIPVGISLIIIVLAFVFIQFKAKEQTDAAVMIEKAYNFITEQNFEEAIAVFEKIIEIDPKNTDAYISIAEIYEENRNFDMAMEWLDKGFDETGSNLISEKLEKLKKAKATGEFISQGISTMSLDALERYLKENEIKYSIIEEYNSDYNKGEIISYSFPSDGFIDKNDEIKIVVSLGDEKSIVPDVVGMTREEAEQLLNNCNLKANFFEKESELTEKGLVISQNIPEKSKVPAEYEIVLEIGAGQRIVAPTVFNQHISEAKSVLDKAGVKYNIEYAANNDTFKDFVFDQSTEYGQEIFEDEIITLWVNSSGEASEKIPPYSGLTVDDYITELKKLGLPYQVLMCPTEDILPGYVVSISGGNVGEYYNGIHVITIYESFYEIS